MTKTSHPATVRITAAQLRSVRRLLAVLPEIAVEPAGSASFFRLTGTEDSLCALGAAIADGWPVCGYRYNDRGASLRHTVYNAIETSLTVPSV